MDRATLERDIDQMFGLDDLPARQREQIRTTTADLIEQITRERADALRLIAEFIEEG